MGVSSTFPAIADYHLSPSQEAIWEWGGQLKRTMFHSQLTLVNGVRRVDDEQCEVPRSTAVNSLGFGPSHSQKEGLGGRQGPPMTDEFRGGNVGTCDAQRHELTSE